MSKALLDKIPSSLRMTSPCAVSFAAGAEGEVEGDGGKKRRFAMRPAYSGGAVSAWWGRMVVDLAGMETPAGKMPILLQHDPLKRAGVAHSIEKGDALSVEGELLENEIGGEIARDADAGFPFQASIGFDILRREWIEEGDAKTVNGQEFAGPGLVITKSALRETSVVTLGADGNTEASVFAWGRDGSGGPAPQGQESTMDAAEFAKKFPEAVAAWKREGADGARAELGVMLKELPEDAPFVAEQFAAGADARSIKTAAALSAKRGVELANERAAREAAEAKLAKLTRQPGIGFSANEDGQLGAESGAGDAIPADDVAAKKKWDGDASLRAEFAGRFTAYTAWLRKAREKAGA